MRRRIAALLVLAVAVPAASSVTVASAETGSLASLGDTRQLSAAATDAHGAAIPEAAIRCSSRPARPTRTATPSPA